MIFIVYQNIGFLLENKIFPALYDWIQKAVFQKRILSAKARKSMSSQYLQQITVHFVCTYLIYHTTGSPGHLNSTRTPKKLSKKLQSQIAEGFANYQLITGYSRSWQKYLYVDQF